ncbi:MAG TPA: tetratricopeptide repeat protein, partial [Candidatus Polarisedimenticolia bacterium]
MRTISRDVLFQIRAERILSRVCDAGLAPRRIGPGARRRRSRRGLLAIAVLCCAIVASPARTWAQEDARGASLGKIASLQNKVETKPVPENWAPAALNQTLYARYHVRTGTASRAGILYSDQTLHRLNEKSEIEIQAPTAEKPGLISLLLGSHYFSSRTPKQFSRIETPAVTAAIRGTEFVVDVASDTTTRITMLEGVLEASNPQGSLTVRTGEQAYVEPGKAPIKRIIVHPRDAVAWALYYPPVLGGSDATRLEALGSGGRDLARAAELLSAGQVDQAKPLIEAAREARPKDPVALALVSVIEVTGGEKDKALQHAEEALSADPHSAAAALALSFAAQASFDIARARAMAEKAAEEDPESSLALARAAELRMAEGDLKGAEAAARKAVERAPDESRALTVLGFAQLTQFRSREAETLFERSVSADTASPLARLGLGLARIRRGRVDDGREELQTAVALDPDDSLLRSYLAKAYYEERRTGEADK